MSYTAQYRYYHYMSEHGEVIRIRAKRKPKGSPFPYVLQEFHQGHWQQPCFAEITWGRLSKFHYLGYIQDPRGKERG